MDTLRERLVWARIQSGMRPTHVARAVGMSQPSYVALESGKTTKTTYIAKIAHVLNVNAYWLDTGDGSHRRNVPPEVAEQLINLTQDEMDIVLDFLASLRDRREDR